MEISTQRQGAVTIVRPEGALVGADADRLKGILTDEASASLGRLVVNMEAVAFIDSRGLEILVDVTEAMSDSGQALHLCAVNKTIREVMDLTDLASMFEYFEDAGSAARSFL
jgi:anti-sigma B factor antagonist